MSTPRTFGLEEYDNWDARPTGLIASVQLRDAMQDYECSTWSMGTGWKWVLGIYVGLSVMSAVAIAVVPPRQ
jgi:hypothetical protein